MKTDTPVVIPLHEKLRDELARPLPIESIFIMPGRYGKQTTVKIVRNNFKREFAKLGIEDSPTTHGLRKNAIACLVEAGSTTREVQSITGQSMDMIEHYAKEYERRGLAKGAIVKWEEHSKNS